MAKNNKTAIAPERIEELLNAAETQEHTFWGKEHVVSYRLPNGFTVLGRAACVDPANFDIELGRRYAREDVAKQLWRLEGYLLQDNLHKQGVLTTGNSPDENDLARGIAPEASYEEKFFAEGNGQ